jgi:hypothetical protein
MSDHAIDLQNPETWDFEHAEKQEGRKARRAVVSVAFHREDFHRVADAAQRAGMTTSEFIRNATLKKLYPPTGGHGVIVSTSSGGTGMTRLYGYPPRTTTSPPTLPLRDDELIVVGGGRLS